MPTFLYRLYNTDNQVIYVGVTANVGMRLGQHEYTKTWWGDVARVEVDTFAARPDALAAERAAIVTLSPVHNVTHSVINEPTPRVDWNPPPRSDVKTYRVTAKRWDEGWELHVADLGVTQAKSLALADREVADYIESMTDETKFDVHLDIELGAFAGKVEDLRTAQRTVAEAQSELAARSRTLVEDFRGAGMSGDDIAKVLKISPQRVSQLVKS